MNNADKELTPQEICDKLNAWDGGNGWDARSDWTPLGYATAYPRIGGRIPHIFSAGETDAPARFIAESDSRALIAGWKAAEELAVVQMRIKDAEARLDDAGIARGDGVGEWTIARRIRQLAALPAQQPEHAHCNHESHCCVVNGCPPASYGTK